jgi:hypothetical protein
MTSGKAKGSGKPKKAPKVAIPSKKKPNVMKVANSATMIGKKKNY